MISAAAKMFLCLLLPAMIALADVPQRDLSRAPADAVFFEAEEMRPDGQTWLVREHADGVQYGYPSGLKVLEGNRGGPGAASHVITVPQAGRYRLWVRYLDIHPNQPTDPRYPFKIRLLQNDQPAAEKSFDVTWLRATPEAQKKWDTWARLFVWDFVEADLQPGPCVVELSKLEPIDTGYWRWIDCFVLTASSDYEPDVLDFVQPIYMKIIMSGGGDNHAPVLFNIWGGRGHVTVSKQGIRDGHMAFPPEARMAAGDESPWVDIGATLAVLRGTNLFRLDALTDWYVPTTSSDFTVLLSHTPSEQGLIGRFHRQGSGGGIRILIDPTQLDRVSDARAASREIRSTVESLPAVKGRQPTRFPLITGLYHDRAYTPPDIIETDVRTLQLLGFSGVANSLVSDDLLRQHGLTFQSSQCTTYWLLKDQCLHQPDWENIRRYQEENLKNYAPSRVQWIKLMDEIYSVTLEHLGRCGVCAEKFGQYLTAQGLSPAAPVIDKSVDAKLFYHTMRFRSQTQVDFLKGCSQIVRSLRPDVHTIANATTELTFSNSKNLLVRGTDWFELYKQDALTFGFVQDPNAATPSQQTISYTMDFLRSACKYRGQSYGIYNMISRTPWDIGAKSFAEIGHGARFIDFYNWGPHYADGSDAQSHRPEIYPVLKEFTHAVGAVEDELLQAAPMNSKIALLYSHTTDIWDLMPQDWHCERQIFGAELMYLHLLLSHLGYPIDILTEDDVLEDRAADYEAIFVTGSHLKDGVVAKLIAWTHNGGLLHLSAGAAERNQYNEPASELELIGLERQAFVFHETPGHEDAMPQMQVIGRAVTGQQALDVVGGYQMLAENSGGRILLRRDGPDSAPYAAEFPHGRGRVVFSGFFPAMSYVRQGCLTMQAHRQRLRSEGKELVTWNPPAFPAAYRKYLQSLLDPLEFAPPVRISHYLVEGSLLAGDEALVLALANWSGEAQEIDVAVRVPDSRVAGEPRAAIGSLKDVRHGAGLVNFTMPVHRGDFVVIPLR